MIFIFFVEGQTEKEAALDFLIRWVNKRLTRGKVGKRSVDLKGFGNFHKEVERKAPLHLNAPGSEDVIAGIGLLDLHGPNFYPNDKNHADERYTWGKQYFEEKVDHLKFRMFFAVHDVEAWVLAHPQVLPRAVSDALPINISHAEKINFRQPPCKVLDRLYRSKLNRSYKKVTDGKQLFAKLDIDKDYNECPHLASLLSELLGLAQQAGL